MPAVGVAYVNCQETKTVTSSLWRNRIVLLKGSVSNYEEVRPALKRYGLS